jgi:hypothetical protein
VLEMALPRCSRRPGPGPATRPVRGCSPARTPPAQPCVRRGVAFAAACACSDRLAGGSRLILRKERPHPGAQLTFTDVDELRVTAFLTNTPADVVPGQAAGLELRHRQHAPVDGRPRRPAFANHLDTLTARSPSWSPPDASPAPSTHRSPPRLSRPAQHGGGLKPPPQGDSEGSTFISCTAPPSTVTTYPRRLRSVAHQVLIIAPAPPAPTAIEPGEPCINSRSVKSVL